MADQVDAGMIEALFGRALAGRLTPETLAALRELGIGPGGPKVAAYPASAFYGGLEVVRQALFGGLPRAAGQFKLGELLTDAYASTALGAVLVSLVRVLPAQLVLHRLVKNMEGSTNYLRAQLIHLSPGLFELRVEPRLGAEHIAHGSLSAAMRRTAARALQIRLTEADDAGFSLRFSWEV